MIPTVPSICPPRDDRGPLAVDAQCLTCRYNLRGLSPEANCPECNAPVRRSIEPPTLRCASPAWLHQIERGLGLLIDVTSGAPRVISIDHHRPLPRLRHARGGEQGLGA